MKGSGKFSRSKNKKGNHISYFKRSTSKLSKTSTSKYSIQPSQRMNRVNENNSQITIFQQADNIFESMPCNKLNCNDECLSQAIGCKKFASDFFSKYLIDKGYKPRQRSTRSNKNVFAKDLMSFDVYIKKLLSQPIFKLSMNNEFNKMIHTLLFTPATTIQEYTTFTKNKIIYCCVYKLSSEGTNTIHTFILVNGNIIYNSWVTDSFNNENYRITIRMKPVKIVSINTFELFQQLITNPNLNILTNLFGLERSHFTDINKNTDTTLEHFKDSSIIMLSV
jgi:hypothetical protein